MKNLLLTLTFLVGACVENGRGDGLGAADSLPKRGDQATDPTIVSAVAGCYPVPSGSYLAVTVIASDPSGELGSCHGTVAGAFEQNVFMGNSCYMSFEMPCSTLQEVTVDMTIANDHAGLTDVVVTLPVKH